MQYGKDSRKTGSKSIQLALVAVLVLPLVRSPLEAFNKLVLRSLKLLQRILLEALAQVSRKDPRQKALMLNL